MSFDAQFAELNRVYKRHARLDLETAYLGDGDGNIYDTKRDGNVWVRFPAADGNLTAPVSVRLRANIPIQDDDSQQIVKVGVDAENRLAVLDIDFDGMVEQGISPLDANAADKRRNAAVTPPVSYPLYCLSTSAPGDLTTEVYVYPLIYIVDDIVHIFNGELVDLAASIPAAGSHRLACLFLALDDTIEVVASTTKADAEPLGEDDLQECYDGASAGAKPVWAWRLADNASSLSEADKWQDLRQTINAGAVTGLNVQELTDDGAITIKQGTVILNKAGVIAATIADPTTGVDDCKVLNILSITAQAHTVDNSAGSGFDGGGAASDVGTFGGAISDNFTLKAWDGVWYVINNVNVTLA